MGKFGLVSKEEDRAIELMFGEHKSAAETARIMANEGIETTPEKLRYLKKKQFEILAGEQREESTAEFMLDSIKKVIIKFEDLYDQFERLSKKLEAEGETFQQVIVLKELRSMISMSLKRLGEYAHGFERIQAKNINIITGVDMMKAIEQNQNAIFSMGAKIEDGKLVLDNPSPELIDAYHRYKFRAGRANDLLEA